jgi:hypothetical protein
VEHGGHASHEADRESGRSALGEPAVSAGLTVSDHDRSFVPSESVVPRGVRFPFSFRIQGPHGPLERFDLVHDRRMHLIVVRRDLARFQHLHPTFRDGTWTAEIESLEAGVWRAFADFSTDGSASTLGIDLHVAGEYQPERLPPTSDAAQAEGFDVRLSPVEGRLSFEVTRDGSPVDLDPYLGARGHLVVLRDGDLAFLHVHPTGDRLDFAVTYPSPGRYRLFLQFSVDAQIRLVAFTQARVRQADD